MSKDKRRLSLKKFFSDGKFTTNNKKDLPKVDYNDNDTKIHKLDSNPDCVVLDINDSDYINSVSNTLDNTLNNTLYINDNFTPESQKQNSQKHSIMIQRTNSQKQDTKKLETKRVVFKNDEYNTEHDSVKYKINQTPNSLYTDKLHQVNNDHLPNLEQEINIKQNIFINNSNNLGDSNKLDENINNIAANIKYIDPNSRSNDPTIQYIYSNIDTAIKNNTHKSNKKDSDSISKKSISSNDSYSNSYGESENYDDIIHRKVSNVSWVSNMSEFYNPTLKKVKSLHNSNLSIEESNIQNNNPIEIIIDSKDDKDKYTSETILDNTKDAKDTKDTKDTEKNNKNSIDNKDKDDKNNSEYKNDTEDKDDQEENKYISLRTELQKNRPINTHRDLHKHKSVSLEKEIYKKMLKKSEFDRK